MQPLDDVLNVMRSTWGLFRPQENTCGQGGGCFTPTFLVSLLGSACINEIRPRFRLQYFKTIFRMVEFIEHMRTLFVNYSLLFELFIPPIRLPDSLIP